MSDGVLNQSWHNRLCKRNHVKKLLCFRCGREIKVGDRVHTNSGQVRNKFMGCVVEANEKPLRVYHLECFEQMFIEC
jgi:hypothetical protein